MSLRSEQQAKHHRTPALIGEAHLDYCANDVGSSPCRAGRRFAPSLDFDFQGNAPGLVPAIGAATLAVTRALGTATRVNAAGRVELVAADTPRFDFDPVTLACRGLLIECASTNLCLRSSEFDNATWTGPATVTANNENSPDGTLNADTLTDSSAVAFQDKSQAFVVANDALTHVFSIYVKKTTGGVAPTFAVNLNLSGGVAVSANPRLNTDLGTGNFAVIEDKGTHWRVAHPITNNASGNTALAVSVYAAAGPYHANPTSANDNAATQGSASVWGAQLEKANLHSSYIPTAGATVTRNTDVPSIPPALGSWFNAAELSVFAEFSLLTRPGLNAGRVQVVFEFSDNTDNERIGFYAGKGGGDVFSQYSVDGGALLADTTAGVVTHNVVHRAAMAFKLNDFAVSLNGAPVAVDNAVTMPTVDRLHLGSSHGVATREMNGHLRRLTIYSTRLANASLELLALKGLIDFDLACYNVFMGESPCQDTANFVKTTKTIRFGSRGMPQPMPPGRSWGTGKALQFDGVDDYVTTWPGALAVSGDNGSLEMWIKDPALGAGAFLARSDANVRTYIQLSGAGTDVLCIKGNPAVQIGASVPVVAGVPHHVVLTWRLDGATRKACFYFDGVRIAHDVVFTDATAGNYLTVGGFNEAGTQNTKCGIDAVRLYSGRALNALEVAEHFRGIYRDESSLVLKWDFEDLPGLTTADGSGGGKTGNVFGTPEVMGGIVIDHAAGPVRPYLIASSPTPTQIDTDKGLAMRSQTSITFADEPARDDLDKYVDLRTVAAGGTFWQRFFARNPNAVGRFFSLRKGYVTSPFDWSTFQTELFTIESVRPPNANDVVTVVVADAVKLLDRVTIPVATDGKLIADLPAISAEGFAAGGSANTIVLDGEASSVDDFYNGQEVFIRANAGAGQRRIISDYAGPTRTATVSVNWLVVPVAALSVYEISPLELALDVGQAAQYPAPGAEPEFVCIGDEVIRYTAKVGDKLTWPDATYREQFGTAREDHSAKDAVKLCRAWVAKPAATVLENIINEGGLADTYIDLTGLAIEAADWLTVAGPITACIPEPTKASELYADLLKDLNFMSWWHPVEQRVRFKFDGPELGATVPAITDDKLMKGRTTVEPLDAERITRAAIDYALKAATADRAKRQNYRTIDVFADGPSESANGFNEKRQDLRQSRWLGAGVNELLAKANTQRKVMRRKLAPRLVKGWLDPKDEQQLGALNDVTTRRLTDAAGNAKTVRCRVTKVVDRSSHFELEWRTTPFTGRYGFICPNGYPNYGAATADQRRRAFIASTTNGVSTMSDGSSAYLIS